MKETLQKDLFDLHPSLKNKYKIEDKLGGGSFGDIYTVFQIQTNKLLAMKVEKKSTSYLLTLKREAKILQIFRGNVGFPKIHLYAQDSKNTLVIMDLLGYNLEKLFKMCKYKFSLKTVIMIADQMIQRVETLHSKGIIHRDIKPENWVIGNDIKNINTVFMIDFGLGKYYKDKEDNHIPFINDKGLIGTARYCSVNSHLGYELSRRDDLECIAYSLIYFLKGKLPWQDLDCNDKHKKYERIKEIKKKTLPDELCEGLPIEFANFLKICKNLNFTEAPNYKSILKEFHDLLAKHNYVYDYKFDWCDLVEITKRIPQEIQATKMIQKKNTDHSYNFKNADIDEELSKKKIFLLSRSMVMDEHLGNFIQHHNKQISSAENIMNPHEESKNARENSKIFKKNCIEKSNNNKNTKPIMMFSSINRLTVDLDNKKDGSSYVGSSKRATVNLHPSLMKLDSDFSEQPKVCIGSSPKSSEKQDQSEIVSFKQKSKIDNEEEEEEEENIGEDMIDEFSKGKTLEMQMNQIKIYNKKLKNNLA